MKVHVRGKIYPNCGPVEGGQVSVVARSEGLGKGAEFVVVLPVANVAPPIVDAKTTVEQSSHRRRVLVVDDNHDAASTLAMLLRALGNDTQLALSGEKAVEVANQFLPELVFLDLGMPGMNGYKTAKAPRANPRLRDTVLVALTGWGQEEDRRRTSEAGFDRHLVKPADAAAIQDVFQGLNKRR